jgi:hypothetical protein
MQGIKLITISGKILIIIMYLLQLLTFMGPCNDNVFLSMTNKMQRYIILFITVNAVHVLSGFSAHHQELKSVHAASGICQTCLLLKLVVTAKKQQQKNRSKHVEC